MKLMRDKVIMLPLFVTMVNEYTCMYMCALIHAIA